MQKHFDVVEKELSYETKHVSFRHRRSENDDMWKDAQTANKRGSYSQSGH